MSALPVVTPDQVVIVVPTFNERANLEALTQRVFAAVPAIHLLVIDDNSPDGTADLCRELMRQHRGLDIVVRRGERGLGGALVAGYKEGLRRGYAAIGSMDADLSHDPAALPAMVERLSECDFVAGSRYIPGGRTVGWGFHRKALSWSANRFAATLLGLRLRDVTTNFRLIRAPLLARIDLDHVVSSGYSFQVEIVYRLLAAGGRVCEQAIVFADRCAGESKMTLGEITSGMSNLLRLWHRVGRLPRSPAT